MAAADQAGYLVTLPCLYFIGIYLDFWSLVPKWYVPIVPEKLRKIVYTNVGRLDVM